jgi:hypothetical protein
MLRESQQGEGEAASFGEGRRKGQMGREKWKKLPRGLEIKEHGMDEQVGGRTTRISFLFDLEDHTYF